MVNRNVTQVILSAFVVVLVLLMAGAGAAADDEAVSTAVVIDDENGNELAVTDESTEPHLLMEVTPVSFDENQAAVYALSASSEEIRFMKDPYEFLSTWNDKMWWRISDDKLKDCSTQLEQYLSDRYSKDESGFYEINDYSAVLNEVKDILHLSNLKYKLFVEAEKLSFKQAKANAHNAPITKATISQFLSPGTVSINSAAPSNQAAPYAYGKCYYLYIFVDFPYVHGSTWTTNDKNKAMSDLYYATNKIKEQSPSGAKITNAGGYVTVSVTGSNPGNDPASYYYSSSWVERAAKQLISDTNRDGMYTDDLSRYFKLSQNADSVILVFLTHDDKGAYSIGWDYSDRCVVSFKGVNGDTKWYAEISSYEHEILHCFGAADEYGKESGVNEACGFAVEPMYSLYRNTNHENGFHTHSIMCSAMYDPCYTISQSTKKFIGWGDYDYDGYLDPLDNYPKDWRKR